MPFKTYIRLCRRCDNVFYTYSKKGRFCDKCRKKRVQNNLRVFRAHKLTLLLRKNGFYERKIKKR